MGRFLSLNFWAQAFVSTFVTLTVIYVIKLVAGKYNIPVVSDIAQSV